MSANVDSLQLAINDRKLIEIKRAHYGIHNDGIV